LLSPAKPWTGFGVVVMFIIMLMSPCQCCDHVDPISVDNRIWGDENRTCWCDADGSRLLSSAMLGALVRYHTQI
jgi:hypothetical protein